MTPKTIFTIILKIFGLWLILGLLEIIPQTLSTIPLLLSADTRSQLSASILLLLVLAFYFFVIRLLLFKSNFIIDKLLLDKHFDQQTIEFNIQQTAVIQIAIIVFGGLIFINSLPVLFEQIVSYLKQKQLAGSFFDNPSFQYLLIYSGKLILGYLLMSNSKWLTNKIDSIQK